jgi:hypothetical protein
MTTLTQLFPLGNVYQTPGVLEAIPSEDVFQALARHQSGDWGDLGAEDKRENEFSLGFPSRLLSAYHAQTGEKFWILTEADRSATTVLLPSEY